MTRLDETKRPPWRGILDDNHICKACGKDLSEAVRMGGVDAAQSIHVQAHMREHYELVVGVLQRAQHVAKRFDFEGLERDVGKVLSLFGVEDSHG